MKRRCVMANSQFITEDFLLGSKQAQELYHEYARDMPIIDYHCHLSPADIAEDKQWENITQIWLYGDHYKWRAMRTNGVAENFCTGDAPDKDKFDKWAETMPCLLRNPLYHWTHMELKAYFSISDRLLGPDTADEIWESCNERILSPDFSARSLMQQSNVELVCTTDDPTDSLEHHMAVAQDDSFKIAALPTWRPDKAMAVDNLDSFNSWTDKLAIASATDISSYGDFMAAICNRHDFFHENGCRLSDHGIDTAYATDYTSSEIDAIFDKARSSQTLDENEILKFKSALLYEFGIMDHAKNWTQQFHFGAMRNNNTRMFKKMGPDIGFDSIGDRPLAEPLSRLLGRLDDSDQLARTILYNLNPRDNALLVSMLGNFQDGLVAGKIQHGSAWWVLDQKDGMEQQMETLSQMGLLSRFVGMLTDSRSFLSYTRHDYFRRILCNMLGNDIAQGLVPNDMKLVGNMVQDICYNNSKAYFGFEGA
jgi:glucuronate isomerase